MKWHFVFLAATLACMQSASAQDVRRCIKTDGSVVFTDRDCTENEQERIPQPLAPQASPSAPISARPYIQLPPSCNRTPDDLLYAVRSAIDMQDVNQLAKHYHWPGTSDLQAEKLMDRLEAAVNAPLIDIQLLYPSEPDNAPEIFDLDQSADSDALEEYDYPISQPAPPHRAPYALRVTQFLSSTNTQAQSSTFRLQRHFECWWIRY